MEDRVVLRAAQKTEQGKGNFLLIWVINPTDVKNNSRVIYVNFFHAFYREKGWLLCMYFIYHHKSKTPYFFPL